MRWRKGDEREDRCEGNVIYVEKESHERHLLAAHGVAGEAKRSQEAHY